MQLSNEDYIAFYPTQECAQVSTNGHILNQGVWQNAAWTAFEPKTAFNLAKTRISYQGKEYWGLSYTMKAVNNAQDKNGVVCDFFNEKAFNSVDKVLRKLL